MITLTRLSGSAFALNSDLIERVDSTPDTVVSLIDGTKYVVRETLEEVVLAVREYRGQVIAAGSRLTDAAPPASPAAGSSPLPPPPLRLAPTRRGRER